MLPISKLVLIEELTLAQRILNKWQQKLADGIPGVELPAAEEEREFFLQEFCGELMLLAGKFERVAEIMANQ